MSFGSTLFFTARNGAPTESAPFGTRPDPPPADGVKSIISEGRLPTVACSRVPKRFVLCHHDDWLPGFSRAIDTKPIREESARVYPRAEMVELPYLSGYRLFEGL